MRRKAQVLIVSLWILIILSLLSVSIGYRVSLALRMSRYHKERLEAYYLAKAGINMMIRQIEKDDSAYDSWMDAWADNEKDFKLITFGKETGFASVGYVLKERIPETVIYGAIDEERKININTSSREVLSELFSFFEVADPDEAANNVCAWRGDTAVTIPEYKGLGYENKAKKFSVAEEMKLVKGISAEDYEKVADSITVYPSDGQGKVNINTAAEKIIAVLINASFRKLQERGVPVENPDGLTEEIVSFRAQGGIFKDTNLEICLSGISDLQKNIINDPVDGFNSKVCVKSSLFRIFSTGGISRAGPKSRLECVYNRDGQRIVFWHEN